MITYTVKDALSEVKSKKLTVYSAVESIIDIIDKHISNETPFALILNLPTGYGKTNLSIVLGYYIMRESPGLFERVVHVIPTRFLADDICRRAEELGVKYAVQYMWAETSAKAPYFLHKYIVTTYDSFMLNYYKACVANIRSDHGHFEVPRYAILSSLVFFDEYHLLTPGDETQEERESTYSELFRKSWTALTRTLKQLCRVAVPIILSTATCISKVQSEIRSILEDYSPPQCKVYIVNLSKEKKSEIRHSDKVLEINLKDEEFEAKFQSTKLSTYVSHVRERREFIEVTKKIVQEYASKGKRILIVCNTIPLAQEAYDHLKDTYDNVILLHSRFTVKDRAEKQRRIAEELNGKGWIVVATQVVEVGVNIDADVLITEIAPLVPLVQRCGRVARAGCEEKDDYAVYVILIEKNFDEKRGYSGVYHPEITRKTYEKLYSISNGGKTIGNVTFRKCNIQWRLPYDVPEGYISYTKLAEEVYASIDLSIDEQYDLLLKSIDESILVDKPIVNEILERICSFIRDSMVVSIYVPSDNVRDYSELESLFKRGVTQQELFERLVPVDLKLVPRLIRNGVLMTVGNEIVGIFEDAERGELKLLTSNRLHSILSDLRRYRCDLVDYVEHKGNTSYYLVALVARGDKYDSTRGLAIE